MFKAKAIVIVAMMGWASVASAQETTAVDSDAVPRWNVQVDPLTYALGIAHVYLEGAISDNFSFYVGPNMRLYDGIINDTPEPYVGLGLELGGRWFPWGRAPSGAWLQVRTVGAILLSDAPNTPSQALGGYAGVLGGYTWILADRWVLSAGLGIQRFAYRIGDFGLPTTLYPAAHTAIGVAF